IAEAESKVHGVAVEQIHFHEVGAMDAIADIVGVSLLLEQLAPQRIIASPIHVGSGFVRCQHGLLPVPAPATALLLQGIPSYGGMIRGELCTPTGAALLKHFVSAFSAMPVLQVEKIGYGMGSKEFEAANCLRAFWGETADAEQEIVELVCNLDDMTPETLGFAQAVLFEAGALDVFVTPITMKKGRAAMMLTCLAKTEAAERLSGLILKHTSTIGVRQSTCKRYVLTSSYETVQTEFGPIQLKTSQGYGVCKTKAEFDDVAKAAKEHHLTIEAVMKALPPK
ncbi:MAG: nickel pincer cofactor biosynthesis protein LarC, partial [Negativicutes bacterium]|nr:nickel pincer cofactor biosynthesis protein LarC [Negativicutes bacterium]